MAEILVTPESQGTLHRSKKWHAFFPHESGNSEMETIWQFTMIFLLALVTRQLRSKFVGLASHIRFYDLGIATLTSDYGLPALSIFSLALIL